MTSRKVKSDKPDSMLTDAAIQARAVDKALTSNAGDVFTLRGEQSSLTIGRAAPLPADDSDEELDEYPAVKKRSNDYDGWLG